MPRKSDGKQSLNALIPVEEYNAASEYCKRRTKAEMRPFSLTTMIRLALKEYAENHKF